MIRTKTVELALYDVGNGEYWLSDQHCADYIEASQIRDHLRAVDGTKHPPLYIFCDDALHALGLKASDITGDSVSLEIKVEY
jgi:hypothetical protein